MASLTWNPLTKLVLADVDETVADVYTDATPEMIRELTSLLKKGIILFFVSGGGLQSIEARIIEKIPSSLRKHVLIAHCSGAEVWGYNQDGTRRAEPFYSVYDKTLTPNQKHQWRTLVADVLKAFELKTYAPTPVAEFKKRAGDDPLAIMYADRGPQITLEFVNAYDLTPEQVNKLKHDIPETHGCYDLRIPVLEYADKLFQKHQLPITPKLGGMFALDLVLQGVSKTTAVKYILENDHILSLYGLSPEIVNDPRTMEIWGDKFSTLRGGPDRHMCEAVSKKIRAIDFREEDPQELTEGYNIVIWDGENHLHDGLLEYLKTIS